MNTLIDIVILAKDPILIALALYGIQAWRRQLRGTREYELARQLLESVYKVREMFKVVRDPLGYSSEYPPETLDNFGHPKPELRYEAGKYRYDNRMKPLLEAFHELEFLHIRARIEWGEEIYNTIVPLRRLVIELQIAISDYLENQQPKGNFERIERSEYMSVLFGHGSGKNADDFTKRIDDAVYVFDLWLRPLIKSSFSVYFRKRKAMHKLKEIMERTRA